MFHIFFKYIWLTMIILSEKSYSVTFSYDSKIWIFSMFYFRINIKQNLRHLSERRESLLQNVLSDNNKTKNHLYLVIF